MLYLLLFIIAFLALIAGGAWFCWDHYRDHEMPQWLVLGLWIVGAMWFTTWSLVLVALLKLVTTDFSR